MGAALWHGVITAARYAIACPRCSQVGAAVDTDSIGRTMVRCGCSPAPFLMPCTIGGGGAPWAVDLTNLGPDDVDEPPAPAGQSGQCQTKGCHYRVGPRGRHCPKCRAVLNAIPKKCARPGCSTIVGYRVERCEPHRVEAARERNARKARARRARLLAGMIAAS